MEAVYEAAADIRDELINLGLQVSFLGSYLQKICSELEIIAGELQLKNQLVGRDCK